MTTGPTLGRLWARYLELRRKLHGSVTGEERREAEREAGQLRDRLVVNYSPLVKYVASRVGARLMGNVDQEDMISWGVLGLLGAIETYDPDRRGKRAKFESYAISKIRWAILDELRGQDWVPRRVRARAQEIEQTIQRLSQLLRRPPTQEEVAEEVGMRLDHYRNFMDQYSRSHVASLEARLEAEGGPVGEYGSLVADHTAADPQANANKEELRSHLVEAIAALAEQERLVATLYFYDGLTLKEIGKAMNLTEGRISQLLKRATGKLRVSLQGSPLVSGDWRQSLG